MTGAISVTFCVELQNCSICLRLKGGSWNIEKSSFQNLSLLAIIERSTNAYF